MDRRWRHTQAVAERATAMAPSVPEPDRPALVAAAWLHDVGYADPVRASGFHPLDGARHLLSRTWPVQVAGLVAHRSGARFVAAVRGLAAPLRPFDLRRFAIGPVADALTTADQTTGPDGCPVDVEDRFTEMLARHGAGSPQARVHAIRAPALRAAVRRTNRRLAEAVTRPSDGTG